MTSDYSESSSSRGDKFETAIERDVTRTPGYTTETGFRLSSPHAYPNRARSVTRLKKEVVIKAILFKNAMAQNLLV